MHRLLYRDGLTLEQARRRIAALAAATPEAAADVALMTASSPARRAASRAEPDLASMIRGSPRIAMVAGEASGDLLGRRCCSRALRAALAGS